MTPRKLLTVVVLAAVLGFGYYSMYAAPVLSVQNTTYQGGVEWQEDPDRARELAAERDAPILVYYWTTWCTYCQSYDENHYRDERVRDVLDEYVLLAVNIDEPGPGEQLAARHEATYPPQHVVMTPGGEEVTRIGGYAQKDRFLAELRNALNDTAATTQR
jgi:thiol:disulfide interchange protein